MIELSGVSKTYRRGEVEIAALRQVDLRVAAGEFLAITGKSGCGKSTLLHLIGGLEAPSRGRVVVAGRDLATLTEQELTRFRRDYVGVVFQAFNLLPLLTLEENVALPRVLQGASYGQAAAEARQWLAQVGLAHRAQHKPHQVSGGEMQRAALARALINRPAVLLADEPTGNLDHATSRQVMELFAALHRKQGQTIIMVTHAPEAAAYAQREVRLRDGRVAA
ncbi:MAG: ABC transporter ATP-binding protein [Syntrophobacterales bacterium]|nr:ABC transporter ATP-binding protein [Syntrophobacterales bacterium]